MTMKQSCGWWRISQDESKEDTLSLCSTRLYINTRQTSKQQGYHNDQNNMPIATGVYPPLLAIICGHHLLFPCPYLIPPSIPFSTFPDFPFNDSPFVSKHIPFFSIPSILSLVLLQPCSLKILSQIQFGEGVSFPTCENLSPGTTLLLP